jgi:hypothetical protein
VGRRFKTPDFASWAKDESVDDSALLTAIQEIDDGLIDAKLGGNVIKNVLPVLAKVKVAVLEPLLLLKSMINQFLYLVFLRMKKRIFQQKKRLH